MGLWSVMNRSERYYGPRPFPPCCSSLLNSRLLPGCIGSPAASSSQPPNLISGTSHQVPGNRTKTSVTLQTGGFVWDHFLSATTPITDANVSCRSSSPLRHVFFFFFLEWSLWVVSILWRTHIIFSGSRSGDWREARYIGIFFCVLFCCFSFLFFYETTKSDYTAYLW